MTKIMKRFELNKKIKIKQSTSLDILNELESIIPISGKFESLRHEFTQLGYDFVPSVQKSEVSCAIPDITRMNCAILPVANLPLEIIVQADADKCTEQSLAEQFKSIAEKYGLGSFYTETSATYKD